MFGGTSITDEIYLLFIIPQNISAYFRKYTTDYKCLSINHSLRSIVNQSLVKSMLIGGNRGESLFI